jgi:putative ABC transport system substrate-binding protein
MLANPLVAAAQTPRQQEKLHRVAILHSSSLLADVTRSHPPHPAQHAFVLGLHERGYVEGKNLLLDVRSLEGRFERAAEVVADIVRLKPDVIVLTSLHVVQRAHGVSAGIPIVVLAGGGIVESGLVKSLARPGGTVTGVIMDVDSAVEAKRLELLREVLPKMRRLAFLGSPRAWESPWGRSALAAARSLGLSIAPVGKGDTSADYDDALAAIDRERPDAVFVPIGAVAIGQREKIGRFVAEKRIPCSASYSEVVEHGCLMSYGVSAAGAVRHAASYVARILQGAKPGDLPMEQPTTFDLVINLKTARALGLTIPQTLLLRADRVIE